MYSTIQSYTSPSGITSLLADSCTLMSKTSEHSQFTFNEQAVYPLDQTRETLSDNPDVI